MTLTNCKKNYFQRNSSERLLMFLEVLKMAKLECNTQILSINDPFL